MEVFIMFYNPEEYEIRVWVDGDISRMDAVYDILPEEYLWISGNKPKEIYYACATYLCLCVGVKKLSYSQDEIENKDNIEICEISGFIDRKLWKYL